MTKDEAFLVIGNKIADEIIKQFNLSESEVKSLISKNKIYIDNVIFEETPESDHCIMNFSVSILSEEDKENE